MSISLNLVAGGDLKFWYNVDSEATYDFLRFYIDGVQQDSWSGSIGWTEATYSVSAGQRTFEWRYTKDGSVSTGADAAWVDFITFPAAAFPEVDVAPGSVDETIGYDSQSQQLLTINNTGEGPLDYTVAWILLTFLGVFGIHRFYQQKWLSGALYLLTGGLLDVVGDPVHLDRLGLGFVDAVGGAPVLVPRLADAAHGDHEDDGQNPKKIL